MKALAFTRNLTVGIKPGQWTLIGSCLITSDYSDSTVSFLTVGDIMTLYVYWKGVACETTCNYLRLRNLPRRPNLSESDVFDKLWLSPLSVGIIIVHSPGFVPNQTENWQITC